MHKLTVAVLVASTMSCGSDAAKPITQTVTGTISGKSFDAKDAVFNLGEWSNGFPYYGTTTAVEISDFASQCTFDTSDQQPPNTQTLTLVLAETDAGGSSSPASSPGDYTIVANLADLSTPSARLAGAWYDLGGSGLSGSYDCFKASSGSAAPSGGKVTVTSVSADRIEGNVRHHGLPRRPPDGLVHRPALRHHLHPRGDGLYRAESEQDAHLPVAPA